MPAAYTEQELKRLIKEKHGDKIDTSVSDLTNGKSKYTDFICKEHGLVHTQIRRMIESEFGCPLCNEEQRYKKVAKANRTPVEVIVKRLYDIHGDAVTLDESTYVHGGHKARFTCNAGLGHPPYLKVPHDALSQRQGCPLCGIAKRTAQLIMPQDEFIERAQQLHPTLDFSEFEYKGNRFKSTIICSEHGRTEVMAGRVLNNKLGCVWCASNRKHQDDFIEQATEALIDRYGAERGKLYSLEKAVYESTGTKVTVICPDHGEFTVTPSNLIQHRRGCPTCGQGQRLSRGERYILEQVQDIVGEDNVKSSDRTVLAPREIDILIPEQKLGIEHHGITYHSSEYQPRRYHREKYEMADTKGYRLIQVFSDELEQKRHLVISVIYSALGVYAETIYARKTRVVELDSATYREFCDANHLQGHRVAKVKLGLMVGDRLVSVLSFQGNELVRFCNETFVNVVGGFPKLFKYYLREYAPTEDIFSFCDLRYFTGTVYEANGFELVGITEPNYSYVMNKHTRHSRQKYMKHKLESKLERFDPDLSEKDNMEMNGFYRIYDCGNKKYVFKI